MIGDDINNESLAQSLVDGMIDELVVDLCFDEHYSIKQLLYSSTTTPTILVASLLPQHDVDIFGQRPPRLTERSFKCEHCKRPIGVNKYAPHLEKCMGKGRGARTARRSSRPVAPESILMPSSNIWRQWDDEYDTRADETEYFAATNRHKTSTSISATSVSVMNAKASGTVSGAGRRVTPSSSPLPSGGPGVPSSPSSSITYDTYLSSPSPSPPPSLSPSFSSVLPMDTRSGMQSPSLMSSYHTINNTNINMNGNNMSDDITIVASSMSMPSMTQSSVVIAASPKQKTGRPQKAAVYGASAIWDTPLPDELPVHASEGGYPFLVVLPAATTGTPPSDHQVDILLTRICGCASPVTSKMCLNGVTACRRHTDGMRHRLRADIATGSALVRLKRGKQLKPV